MIGDWKARVWVETGVMSEIGSGKLEGGVALARSRPLRIGVFGQFGIDNFGNDASMEAMLDFLKRECPDAQVTVICPQPDVIERTHSIPTIRTNLLGRSGRLFWLFDRLLLRVPRTVSLLLSTIGKAREMDVLIVAGGGVLEEPTHRLSRMHWTLALWCTAARMSGKKIAFVSIGAAPINNALVRRLLTTAFGMAHYKSFRDENSRQCMIQFFGVDVEGVPVYPDIAFGLPEPSGLLPASPRNDDSLCIGLGPMSLWGWYGEDVHKSYVDKLVDCALLLARSGYRIRLMVADKADYRAVDDIIRLIMAKAPELLGDKIIADHIVCTQDLMRQIVLTDVVICSRYHHLAYALKLGKPVIGIGYSPKQRALLEEVGLGKFIQAADRLDVALLQEQFIELLKDRKTHELAIEQANARFRDLRRQQEAILCARLLGRERED